MVSASSTFLAIRLHNNFCIAEVQGRCNRLFMLGSPREEKQRKSETRIQSVETSEREIKTCQLHNIAGNKNVKCDP